MRHRRIFRLPLCIAGGAFLVAAWLANAKEEPRVGISPDARAAIDQACGTADPGTPRLLAARLGPEQISTAIYSGSRVARLLAIDAGGELGDPWPILPILAALLQAHDRAVAARAVGALLKALERGGPDSVSGQRAQLAQQLASAAGNLNLDADVRVGALRGIELLERSGQHFGLGAAWLLSDGDIEVRRQAFARLAPPLSTEALSAAARSASDPSEEPRLRGQFAAMLCENALYHQVTAPSKDLSQLLSKLLADKELPAEAIAPVLACLAHFEGEARAQLVETALAHPDPAIAQFWKERNQSLRDAKKKP